jgi:hypothetical protein
MAPAVARRTPANGNARAARAPREEDGDAQTDGGGYALANFDAALLQIFMAKHVIPLDDALAIMTSLARVTSLPAPALCRQHPFLTCVRPPYRHRSRIIWRSSQSNQRRPVPLGPQHQKIPLPNFRRSPLGTCLSPPQLSLLYPHMCWTLTGR